MAIKKYKRAYQYSEDLLKICERQTDKLTALESKAYSFYLFGLYVFEQENWKEAQSNLIASREILAVWKNIMVGFNKNKR